MISFSVTYNFNLFYFSISGKNGRKEENIRISWNCTEEICSKESRKEKTSNLFAVNRTKTTRTMEILQWGDSYCFSF